MEFDLKEIRPNVFHVDYETQYHLTSTFMRLQEFYESPYESIRGKYFTHEQYMDRYAEDRGTMSYFTDWGGFNVPSNVIENFMDLFGYSLNVKENALMVPLMSIVQPRLEEDPDYKYYLIGTFNACEETLNHELCHAYWYIDEEYRSIVSTFIDNLYDTRRFDYHKLETGLLNLGYCGSDEIIADEIQAFLATRPRKSLISTLGLDKDFRVPSLFKKNFKQFNEEQMK